MGWPSQEPFYVPEDALGHFRGCVERGAEQQAEWQQRFDQYSEAHPELAQELRRLFGGELLDGWDEEVPRFHASGQMTATRKSSHTVLQWAAARVPELVGGAADLAPSTLTKIDDADDVEAGSYAGRNLHFGIREHAMGAIVNGLTLHYLRAYGSTFLVFSDYMRGSIRLAALMGLPSIFVYTHDSIGLGEDGPTHQPIEHRAAQPADYRDQVLPGACRARVSVEAASTVGWHRWVGDLGEVIGLDTFGASAPAGVLYKHFGFTPERVADSGRHAASRAKGE